MGVKVAVAPEDDVDGVAGEVPPKRVSAEHLSSMPDGVRDLIGSDARHRGNFRVLAVSLAFSPSHGHLDLLALLRVRRLDVEDVRATLSLVGLLLAQDDLDWVEPGRTFYVTHDVLVGAAEREVGVLGVCLSTADEQVPCETTYQCQ